MTREIEGGKEIIEAELPLVLGCQEPIAEWKIPNMRGIMTARSKPLNVVEPNDPTIRTETNSFELPPAKGEITLVDADNVSELINLLKNEAKVI
jgi:electron transfer flavoprotein beta subunit